MLRYASDSLTVCDVLQSFCRHEARVLDFDRVIRIFRHQLKKLAQDEIASSFSIGCDS